MKKFNEINWLDDACEEYGISTQVIEDACELYVDVKYLEQYMQDFPNAYRCICAAEKMSEQDKTEIFHEKGTRKPADRNIRRKATEKAKRHLAEIEPLTLTMSVRKTRNGAYIRKGNTYSWNQGWKRMNVRLVRHEGKRLAREFMEY